MQSPEGASGVLLMVEVVDELKAKLVEIDGNAFSYWNLLIHSSISGHGCMPSDECDISLPASISKKLLDLKFT